MIRVLQCVANMDRSGAETMLLNYYRNIDHTKVQFDFLCSKKKPGAYDEEIRSMGARIFYAPSMNPLKFPAYEKKLSLLFDQHPEWQIIHSHTSALGWYPLFVAKKTKLPIRIAHMHNSGIPFDKKWVIRHFCKAQIKSVATHLWGCGMAANDYYYGKEAVLNGQTLIINNAIEIEKYNYNQSIRDKIRQKYNLNGNFVVGHVGRFIPLKNHSFLLDVFAELYKRNADARLVLLGNGPLESDIRKKAETLGLKDMVLMLGNVENSNEWYQAFDIFMLPSSTEGLPVVAVEAQTADLPCIFSSNVTREVDLLNTTKYLSLKASVDEWVNEIITQTSNNAGRKDRALDIRRAGYDVKEQATLLQNMYINLIKDLKNGN